MKNRDEIKKKIQSMSEEQLVDLFIDNENNKAEIDWYKEQLALLNKLRYSSKSEKAVCGQLNLFNEIEDIQDNPVEEEPVQKKSKKKKTREANFSKLPTKTIEHTLADNHCEICGTDMKELAPQVIDVLKISLHAIRSSATLFINTFVQSVQMKILKQRSKSQKEHQNV